MNPALRLTEAERASLLDQAAHGPPAHAVRSRIVLCCAEGLSPREVAAQLRVSAATVTKWRDRFIDRGLDGLADAPRTGRPRSTERAAAERLVVTAITQARRGGRTPSTRSLARSTGLSQSTITRIWREQSSPPRRAVPAAGPPLPDDTYRSLRNSIVTGELAPGQRLVEAEIARQLGTGQAPAREAIKRLAHEGLVSSLPHRGSYVTEISEDEAREVREVRVLLEEYAARQAAVSIQPRSLRKLADAVEAMRQAAARGDIGTFREADMAFHGEVCAATGNSVLTRLWRTLEPSLWGLHVISNPLYSGDWSTMAERHAALLDALAAGDVERSARLFAQHAHGRGSVAD